MTATPGLAVAVDVQLEQRLDGFGQERYGIAEWDSMIRGSAHAEIAIRGGCPVAIAGWSEPWNGLALVWASLGSECGRSLIPITRRIVRMFSEATHVRRFQTTVRDGFADAHRWATLLGMRRECVMRGYGPDGSDHALYAINFDRRQ